MLAILLKYGLPLIFSILEKLGLVDKAEKLAIKYGYTVLKDVEGVRTYSAPSDFPNPPPTPTPNNINKSS